MRKIPTIFERDWDGDRSRVVDTPNPACPWVFEGEGVATRKWDGTAVMIRAGQLFKRREVKGDIPPALLAAGFEPVGTDAETGKSVGWIPVDLASKEDRWHREAFAGTGSDWEDGTYELVGEKIQGNPEHLQGHRLVRHGRDLLPDAPRDFAGLRDYFAQRDIEGLVWWRVPFDQDSDMAKLKARDFGIRRGRR